MLARLTSLYYLPMRAEELGDPLGAAVRGTEESLLAWLALGRRLGLGLCLCLGLDLGLGLGPGLGLDSRLFSPSSE